MPLYIRSLWVVPASILAVVVAGFAAAQETDMSGQQIAVELNAAQTVETTCQLTFVITNGLQAQIDRLVYEAVLFDAQGQVDRLTLFDFGTLPVARTRVRQFAVPDVQCAQLGRILFNGAQTCQGAGLAPEACASGLLLTSRSALEVLG